MSACCWVAAVLGGIAGASIDVGIGAVVSDRRRWPTRSAAMAGWNALTGARGIVAAFLMSALVQIGLVDVTTGLLLCAVSSLVGVALFVRTRPGVPVETRAWEVRRRVAPDEGHRGRLTARPTAPAVELDHAPHGVRCTPTRGRQRGVHR